MTEDFAKRLPRTLAARFSSIGSYVKGLIEEEDESTFDGEVTPASHVKAIQFVAFVWVLDRTFEEGTRAAERAAAACADLGIRGFWVGSGVFEPGNDNVLLGRRLSQELRRQLDANTLAHLTASLTLKALARRLHSESRSARGLD